MRFKTLRIAAQDRIGTLTLNRPERLNAIDDQMPGEIRAAVERHSPEGLWFKRYAEEHGFPAAVEWHDSGRPLPNVPPGDTGDAFMAAPTKDARSMWSADVTGKRAKKKRHP